MPKHEDNQSGPVGNTDPKRRGLGKTQEQVEKDNKADPGTGGKHRRDR